MSTSTITLQCTRERVRLHKNVIVLVLEYICFLSTHTRNHDYFHDYFNEYPVSNIKATFMESLGVIVVLLLCH